jgi:hypothetical protein
MHMLYNSASFAVVMFEISSPTEAAEVGVDLGSDPAPTRGGFEIVDKLARKDIFIEGAMAETFQAGVEALMADEPSEEDLDEYIGQFTSLVSQPLVLH